MRRIPLVMLLAGSVAACPVLAFQVRPVEATQAVVRLVDVDLPPPGPAQDAAVRRLAGMDLDVALVIDRRMEVLATDRELARLTLAGFSYTVRIEDLKAHYQQGLVSGQRMAAAHGSWLSPPFGGGGMGGYYTFHEIESVLDQLHAAYPGITTAKFSIGQSVESRNLWAIKISDNPGVNELEPEVRIDAIHHAREPESMQASLWFVLYLLESYGSDPLADYLVNEREIWYLPCVNPDGYVYNEVTTPGGGGLWRKNRRNNGNGTFGVDLNRNYPYQWGYDNVGSSGNPGSETYRGPSPLSEPEVVAMVNFIDSHDFDVALTCHTYGELFLYPWSYDTFLPANEAEFIEVSQLATETNQHLVGPGAATLYPANGVTDDYDFAAKGSLCWTTEIGTSFWPATSEIIPFAEVNLESFQRTALAAGAYVRVTSSSVTEVGDADGFFEAGEGVELALSLRNSGRSASGSVTATLVSGSSDLVVTSGHHPFGSLGAYSSADNLASPLTATISASAAAGTSLPYTLSVVYEGYSQDIHGSIAVGEPHPFLIDTMEVDVGWTAGLPGDTATAGRWEYGDPVGTSSGGSPSNPEDDATPGGTRCFVTGNAGGSAGADDVDNGFTTLLSPLFDLSSVSAARLSYARWFTQLTVVDDSLEVALSNNDGASWVSLESVTGNHNSWNTVSFEVADVLPLTSQMRLRVIASDSPNNSLTEAALDDLRIDIFADRTRINFFGSADIGTMVQSNVSGMPGEFFILFASTGTANLSLPGFEGPLLIDPAGWFPAFNGTIPAGGLHSLLLTIPNDANIVGITAYLQAVVFGSPNHFSNRDDITPQ